ncbi:MAG: hydrogenase maturation nickel metallochaperone HypA [Chloroflexi bacterium]|nr:hydrogenase maturation nickel metallochaperone HypA [Chloroflexota bacterium]MCL5075445.1 hydrogenase maturation nickel metallochaperone HypA [Chloroflexota bacterium]
MHELTISENILAVAIAEAEKHRAKRIRAIHLKIGALTQVDAACVSFYLNIIGQGTIAEGVRLETTLIPLTARCSSCQTTFAVSDYTFYCAHCGGEAELVEGKELLVESIEVE